MDTYQLNTPKVVFEEFERMSFNMYGDSRVCRLSVVTFDPAQPVSEVDDLDL